ncbi:MAG: DUF6375 family protein [Chloroflexota bacterium]
MNLVMIGRFKEARHADEAKRLINLLTTQANAEPDAHRHDAGPEDRRFSDAMLELLTASELYSIAAAELKQFAYDIKVRVEDNEVVVTTDEVDVSAFLKVLLEKGARIEVYSAHDYPDTEDGRDS